MRLLVSADCTRSAPCFPSLAAHTPGLAAFRLRVSHLRNLLANHQDGSLVTEVRYITQYLLRRVLQRLFKVLRTLEVQVCLDSVRAWLVGVRCAIELEDRVALETVGAELFLHHGHVGLEVVIEVEGCIGLIGIEDCDLAGRHGDGVGG